MDSIGELLGLRENRRLGLHPEEIGVGGEGDGSVDGALRSSLVSVETLSRSRSVPVPVNRDVEERFGENDGSVVGGVGGLLEVVVDLGLRDLGGLRGVRDGGGVETESGRLGPVVLDLLELLSVRSSSLGNAHRFDQVSNRLVGGTENEGVISLVDVGGDEGSGFGVRSSDREILDSHDIVLESDSDQSVDVLGNGNENLSGHVSCKSTSASAEARATTLRTTLLRSRSLILNVDTGSTLLDKHLGQFHDGGESSVSSVGVGDNRSEVVDSGSRGSLSGSEVRSRFSLLSVVEELGHEQLLDCGVQRQRTQRSEAVR